ncbi:hypothetical protein GA0111570_11018 [Raineyella antarctica]|uniref:Serine aminopeptidase S33 domain-containing protein n=1 Tax=Raineyella antarctica TaxID=1577474 RepID=A0A1G6HH21_9ACTN|nr:alpha/beta hydrolase [Raineyella antarctica]SDB93511.1 hypothetical protein GA0111570_11018 [Raineyella antarctica]
MSVVQHGVTCAVSRVASPRRPDGDHGGASVPVMDDAVAFEEVAFTARDLSSDGARLRGRLYGRGDAGGDRPVVVMANGFTATITMTADKYADVFAAAGLAVLLYDHAGFGGSDADQRLVVNPWLQARGYQDAVTYVSALDGIDASRIAVWGDSLSAAVALVVAAVDERVTAVVAQVPACGRRHPPADPDGTLFSALRGTLQDGEVTGPGTSAGPLPVVSADQLGTPSLLTPLTAFRWFIDHGARHGTGWENVATRFTPDTPVPFHAGLAVPHLAVPSLWLLSPTDEMPGAAPEVARAAYESAGGAKEVVQIRNGHFGLVYWPGQVFEEAAAVQREFLLRVLGEAAR